MNEIDWEYNLEITKSFTDETGALIIAGEASNGIEDEDGEVLDQESLKACFAAYMRNPVVKFMHDKTPQWKGAIGKVIQKAKTSEGEEIYTSFGKTPFLVIKLLEGLPSWMVSAVQSRIYKGLSIGGKLQRRDGNRLVMKAWLETSVVDIPAAKGCFFTVLKAAGGEEEEDKEDLTESTEELGKALTKLCSRVDTFKVVDSLPRGIDEWLAKGGPGSGVRGHMSAQNKKEKRLRDAKRRLEGLEGLKSNKKDWAKLDEGQKKDVNRQIEGLKSQVGKKDSSKALEVLPDWLAKACGTEPKKDETEEEKKKRLEKEKMKKEE